MKATAASPQRRRPEDGRERHLAAERPKEQNNRFEGNQSTSGTRQLDCAGRCERPSGAAENLLEVCPEDVKRLPPVCEGCPSCGGHHDYRVHESVFEPEEFR